MIYVAGYGPGRARPGLWALSSAEVVTLQSASNCEKEATAQRAKREIQTRD